MGHICDCGSAVCDKHIELSDSEAEEIYSHEDWAPSPWIKAWTGSAAMSEVFISR